MLSGVKPSLDASGWIALTPAVERVNPYEGVSNS